MSRPSEFAILHQEIEKVISKIKSRDETIDKILDIIRDAAEDDQTGHGSDMKKNQAYYENPYSLPSASNISARKKKSERRTNIQGEQAESKAAKKDS